MLWLIVLAGVIVELALFGALYWLTGPPYRERALRQARERLAREVEQERRRLRLENWDHRD